MPFDILNILQKLLLPLVAVAVALIGVLVWLGGRKGTPRPPQPTRPPAPPAARPRPSAPEPPEPPAPDRAGRAEAPAAPVQRRTAVPVPKPASPAQPASPAVPVRSPLPVDPVALAPAPVAEAPAAALPRPPAAPPTAQPAPRPRLADLLLVDDSAVVRARLRRLFEPAGYSVVLAQDGEEALGLLAQGSYAVLITDLEMPRLDGVGLIRAAMADRSCAGMVMLAITGHEDLQAKLNELHAVAGIYRKPWVDDELLGHVRQLVAPSLLEADEA
jgi:CheY-like chemotaxis protein